MSNRINEILKKISKIKNKVLKKQYYKDFEKILEERKNNIPKDEFKDIKLEYNKTKDFETDSDIAIFFGDYKLYLRQILLEKQKRHEINLEIDELLDLERGIYTNHKEIIDKVVNILNEDELLIYNNLVFLYNDSIDSKWISKLTDVEKFSIRNYAEFFGSVDKYTAKEKYNYDSLDSNISICELMRAGVVKGSENLDNAIEKFGALKQPINVYRGVAIDALTSQFGQIDRNNLTKLIGQVYTDKSYMSTSLIKERARTAVNKNTDVILKINVPADENYGAYIESQANLNYNQSEFLIQKDSSSIITNAYIDKDDKIIIEMQLQSKEKLKNKNAVL